MRDFAKEFEDETQLHLNVINYHRMSHGFLPWSMKREDDLDEKSSVGCVSRYQLYVGDKPIFEGGSILGASLRMFWVAAITRS